MRILIVEDERALCDAIARSLRNLAYSVDCCHDGQEALDLLGVEVFDLVVLDLNLPRIDGMTVLRELRKTACETKVLILSARGEVSDNGWGNQIRSYVMQPYTMVKDHRTGEETGNVQSVMDGNLDAFMNAYLRWITTPQKA